MKAYKVPFFPWLACLVLLSGPLAAAGDSIYGHISFVDNGAMVLRADGNKDQAVVNLPLAPGDTVVTSGGGRCELQFDNGTVVRLDKGSRLRLATVLAPSLTSSWKVTTLELERGQLYSLPQSYRGEMFQVITPNAAANLKTRVRSYIRLDAGGGTSFFSDGGKFKILYGADSRSLKQATVKSGRPLAVTPDHALAVPQEKRDIEFMAWNEYVDRHFQELHRGISKVPPKLKFGNTALTYWAEKWSSLYGEWIYDDLFGYMWRPYDDRFALSDRPFFFADFVRVNGQLFIVPVEAWAWVPAHMGTWVWMTRGWTWVPGDWFHNGVVSCSLGWVFPTFGYYWNWYRDWRWLQPQGMLEPSYAISSPSPREKLPVPIMPDPVKKLIQRLEKTHAADGALRHVVARPIPAIDDAKLPPPPPKALPAPVPAAPGTVGGPGQPAAAPINSTSFVRDWNDDSRWAARTGHTIAYSSARNAVVCPELKISSDKMRISDRLGLGGSDGGWRRSGGANAAGQTANSGESGTPSTAPPANQQPGDAKAKDDEGRR